MKSFPHQYTITASGNSTGAVIANSRSCPPLMAAEPEEFDGTGEHWSPEQLFVAMVADCLILTFRAIAKASNFEWVDLKCTAEGMLDRLDGVNRFTQIDVHTTLLLADDANEQKGLRLLTKAENQCLIKNSISAQVNFINYIKIEA